MNVYSVEGGVYLLEKLGLERVTIALPFRLDHVHCFIGEGENGHVLMDTGLHDKKTAKVWQAVLADKNLTDIILSHVHPDHIGYAGSLQARSGATVHMSQADSKVMNNIWSKRALKSLAADYDSFALPMKIKEEIVHLTDEFRPFIAPLPKVDAFLHEGKKLKIGKEDYEVIATPGHADGLVCFYQKERQVLLSTDHILPKITPNIAYWFYGEENPLRSYELSLEKIKKLDIAYAIPSHGEAFEKVHDRIDEIWSHHEARLAECLSYMKEAITVYQMCEKLFTPSLSVYDMQFAIGETMAHMEYLRQAGNCKRDLVDGQWYYRRVL